MLKSRLFKLISSWTSHHYWELCIRDLFERERGRSRVWLTEGLTSTGKANEQTNDSSRRTDRRKLIDSRSSQRSFGNAAVMSLPRTLDAGLLVMIGGSAKELPFDWQQFLTISHRSALHSSVPQHLGFCKRIERRTATYLLIFAWRNCLTIFIVHFIHLFTRFLVCPCFSLTEFPHFLRVWV